MMTIHDNGLGEIVLHPNGRARRFIFRVRDGLLQVTVPPGATEHQLRESLDRMRPQLEQMLGQQKERASVRRLSPSFAIDTPHFKFRSLADADRVYVRAMADGLELHCPSSLDWDDEHFQQWVVERIEERMKQLAEKHLRPRLMALAAERGLCPKSVAVRKSKSRWGSCNSFGRINLSLYLLLLPAHLQDYVMHHELTHLLEFNHSPRFWEILNRCVEGRNEELRMEMKQYETNICGYRKGLG